MVKLKLFSRKVVIVGDHLDDLVHIKEAVLQFDSSAYCLSFVFADDALRLLTGEVEFEADYIIVANKMIGIDGAEFIDRLKKSMKHQVASIAVYAPGMDKKTSDNLLKAGATYNFQKPATYIGYLAIVKEVMEQGEIVEAFNHRLSADR